ncbi:hypothetical protein ACFLQL_00370 [Verrucomicrobiota bacterium]
MNEIFITADTHFAHDVNKYGFGGIIRFGKRPFSSIKEHDEYIINRWNETVGKKDLTYICGDFAWRDHAHYIHALNGKKILITGSHDKMPQAVLRLFSEVHNGMLIRVIKKVKFVFTHCALLVWEGSHYNISINCHGHSHMRLEEFDTIRRMDVGIDGAINYSPWNIDFILYKMSLKKKREVDPRNEEALARRMTVNRENNIKLYDQWTKETMASSSAGGC